MKKWPDADTGISEDRERRGYTTATAYTWSNVKRCVWVKRRVVRFMCPNGSQAMDIGTYSEPQGLGVERA